jgi:hypothetical protein
MAKGILEFDLNDQDEVTAHKRCVKSLDIVLALWDMDQYLRAEAKYKDNEIAEEIREKLGEIMSEHSVSFDELIN